MALWNQTPGKEPVTVKDSFATPEPPRPVEKPAVVPLSREPKHESKSEARESILAADLIIEGKIEGSGDVRIAGTFKGDIQVQGNVRIEQGAKVTGEVRGNTVIIGGELDGNISAASRVELLETGILNGDLKAGSLTVAAGSRMRGRAEFGWEGKSISGSKVGGSSV